MIFADLHLHGRFSQATSSDLSLKSLAKWAKVKGISLLGTGDFTHPKWIDEIKSELTEDRTGLFRTGDGFPFILSTEISLIYSQGGKGRRVHLIVLAPSLSTVEKITSYLLEKGRVDYDGRPIFKIPCPEFVEALKRIDDEIEIIPAHIWTPWFSVFGSKSGFDSFEECFGDALKHIHAYETGLSSDPPMNWRVSQLDRFQMLSFSDLHSFWPWRLGREATVFDCTLSYKSILHAIRTGEGLWGTIEVDPNYGKYHFDGHRKCSVSMHPRETRKNGGICPVCKSPMTIGVLYRVEELADKPEGYRPKNPKGYHSLISLSELIALSLGKDVNSKAVWRLYDEIIALGKDELDLLLNVPKEHMMEKADPLLADAIMRNREGRIMVSPGYDGEYGVPSLAMKQSDNKENLDIKKENDGKQSLLGSYL